MLIGLDEAILPEETCGCQFFVSVCGLCFVFCVFCFAVFVEKKVTSTTERCLQEPNSFRAGYVDNTLQLIPLQAS